MGSRGEDYSNRSNITLNKQAKIKNIYQGGKSQNHRLSAAPASGNSFLPCIGTGNRPPISNNLLGVNMNVHKAGSKKIIASRELMEVDWTATVIYSDYALLGKDRNYKFKEQL